MAIKRKKPMSTEDIAKDMNHLILLFGDDKTIMKPLIIAHLVFMGWDRGKAISYAALVKKYDSIRGNITSIWGGG